ncbi:MAG: PDZ domain-containing protein [Nitriliruptoraceae bacterium]
MTTTPGSARRTAYTLSLALVVWAGATVPLPLVEYVPGAPTAIAELIEFEGVDVGEIDGQTSLLTVTLRQQPTWSALWAAIHPDREIQRFDQVYPPDVERDEYLRRQRERFGRQFEVAAAVGARAAGHDATLVTEVVVVDVVVDGPADGRLQPGDVVLRANGTPVTSGDQLQNLVADQQVGTEIELLLEFEDAERRESLRLGQVPGADGPRIGIVIQTAVDELRLPFEVNLREGTRIGGPSAGLMIGLTVYDLLADEDLVAGRTVMGTGSLDVDGTVGSVGGVPEKMRAARAAGADLVLVPHAHVDIARTAAPDLQIVGVRTFEEALDALRRS